MNRYTIYLKKHFSSGGKFCQGEGMAFRLIITICITIIYIDKTTAQAILTFQSPAGNTLAFRSLFNISVSNSDKKCDSAKLIVKVTDSTGKLILKLATKPFVMQRGFINYTIDSFKIASTIFGSTYTQDIIEKFATVPPGKMVMEYQVYNNDENELARLKVLHHVTNILTPVLSSPGKDFTVNDSIINFKWALKESYHDDKKISYGLILTRKADPSDIHAKDSVILQTKTNSSDFIFKPGHILKQPGSVLQWHVLVYYDNHFAGTSTSNKFIYNGPAKLSNVVARHVESAGTNIKKKVFSPFETILKPNKTEANKNTGSTPGLPSDSLKKQDVAGTNKLSVEKKFGQGISGLKPKFVSDTGYKSYFKSSFYTLAKNNIKISGFVQAYGEYYTTTSPSNFYSSPTAYINACPTVTLGIIPINATIFYSNAPGYYQPDIHSVRFDFDASKFQNNLKDQLDARLGSIAALKAEGMGKDALEKELNKTRTELNDPVRFDKMNELDKLGKSVDTNGFKRRMTDSILKFKGQETDTMILMAKDTNNLSADQKKLRKDYLKYEQEAQLLENKVKYYESLNAEKLAYDDLKDKESQYEKRLDTIAAKEKQIKELNQKGLQDPEFLKKELMQNGLLKGGMKYLFMVKKLQIGQIYPSVSPMMMQGYALEGVDAAIMPGAFYAEFIKGQTPQYVNNSLAMPNGNSRIEVLTTRFGIGAPEKSHFHILLFQGNNTNTRQPESYIIPPKSNFIAGLNGQWAVGKSGFVEGEFLRSVSDYNYERPKEYLLTSLNKAVAPANNLFEENKDYAATVKSAVNFEKIHTKLKASVYRVGAQYASLAMPFLANDKQGYQVTIENAFLNNRIKLQNYVRQDIDNLDHLKAAGTNTLSLSSSVTIALKRLPVLQLTFAPYHISNEFSEPGMNFTMTTYFMSANLAHSYSLGKFTGTTMCIYTEQGQVSNETARNYTVKNIQLRQIIDVSGNFQVSGMLGYCTQEAFENVKNIYSFQSVLSYKTKKRLTLSGGYRIDYSNQLSDKHGILFKLSMPVFKNMILDAGYEHNIFNTFSGYGYSYQDSRIHTSLRYNF